MNYTDCDRIRSSDERTSSNENLPHPRTPFERRKSGIERDERTAEERERAALIAEREMDAKDDDDARHESAALSCPTPSASAAAELVVRGAHSDHRSEAAPRRESPASTPQHSREECSETLVRSLYAALLRGDTRKVKSLVAHDLQCWHDGPACHRYMKKLLTGTSKVRLFSLTPLNVEVIGNKVFVQGRGPLWETYWVQIWSVERGRLTQLREYWDTAVRVTDTSVSVTESVRGCEESVADARTWESELWRLRSRGSGGADVAMAYGVLSER